MICNIGNRVLHKASTSNLISAENENNLDRDYGNLETSSSSSENLSASATEQSLSIYSQELGCSDKWETEQSSDSSVSEYQSRQPTVVMTTDHQFIFWPAWPIYSALSKHGFMLGTTCFSCTLDSKSPPEYRFLPEHLRPSPLQLAVVHRRWIDRFPFPRLRDNMILLSTIIDLDDFVRDLFGMASLILRQGGTTWDPKAWIIGSEFASKWGYLFR